MNISIQRIFLYTVMIFIISTLFSRWQTNNLNDGKHERLLVEQQYLSAFHVDDQAHQIKIKTQEDNKDVAEFVIDTHNGNVISNQLTQVPISINESEPTQLLSNNSTSPFYARTGFLNADDGNKILNGEGAWTRVDNERSDNVVLKLVNEGPNYTLMKTFETDADNPFVLKVKTTISQVAQKMSVRSFADFIAKREVKARAIADIPQPDRFIAGLSDDFQQGLFHFNTFTGATYWDEDSHYVKLHYGQISDKPLSKQINDAWMGIQRRYFITGWVPSDSGTYDISTYWTNGYMSPNEDDDRYVQYFNMTLKKSTPEVITSGTESISTEQQLYSGPEQHKYLNQFGRHLDRTIDYGWLHFISLPILNLMKFFYSGIPNWGIAIILVTLTLKLLLYKLSEVGYRTTAKMKKIAPRQEEIKERFADDNMAKNQALVALFKEEKVNPLMGCLPLLLQAPIFLALYWVLMESYELLYAPFLWVQDLSQADPYYILALLVGVSMYFQQRMTATSQRNEMQQTMMYFMPVMMTVLFSQLPAGLVLYMVMNNLASMAQQAYIIRRVNV